METNSERNAADMVWLRLADAILGEHTPLLGPHGRSMPTTDQLVFMAGTLHTTIARLTAEVERLGERVRVLLDLLADIEWLKGKDRGDPIGCFWCSNTREQGHELNCNFFLATSACPPPAPAEITAGPSGEINAVRQAMEQADRDIAKVCGIPARLAPPPAPAQCGTCAGAKTILAKDRYSIAILDDNGNSYSVPCPDCGGTGKARGDGQPGGGSDPASDAGAEGEQT